MDLDHVALATRDVRDALDILVGELGGTVLFGGHSIGFRPMQVRLGDATDGMNIELLEPWEPEKNDFLERFVTRHGAGPHHLTFKVDDLLAAMERVRAAGYQPVMPRFTGHVSEQELLQLIAYIKSLGDKSPPSEEIK